MSIYLSLQAVQLSSCAGVHEVGTTDAAGLNTAGKYTFSIHQEVCWLHQIVTDPRLLQGFKNLCQQVTMGYVPYAPLLALNYQLGGRFTFPSPEALRWLLLYFES